MAKSLSAADMLGRGRRAVDTPAETRPVKVEDEDKDDSPTRRLSSESPSHLVTETEDLPAHERYEKTSAFLTPDQRRWLRSTVRALPVDGLSASDVVRLALDQLRASVEDGLPLQELLIARAHTDAERFSGRRNRGLPQRDAGDRI